MQFDELMYEASLMIARLDPRSQRKAQELADRLEQEARELDQRAQKLIGWLEVRIAEAEGQAPS